MNLECWRVWTYRETRAGSSESDAKAMVFGAILACFGAGVGCRWQLSAQALSGFLAVRTGRAAARAKMFSATAARMSACNPSSSIVPPSWEIDGAPGVAFEAGVEEAERDF